MSAEPGPIGQIANGKANFQGRHDLACSKGLGLEEGLLCAGHTLSRFVEKPYGKCSPGEPLDPAAVGPSRAGAALAAAQSLHAHNLAAAASH